MAMTSIHSTIGIALFKLIPNPIIMLTTSFLSHFIIDIYPEWYPKKIPQSLKDINNLPTNDKKLLLSQLILLSIITYYTINNYNHYLLLSIILANSQDIFELFYNKLFKKNFWLCHYNGFFPFKTSFYSQQAFSSLKTSIIDLSICTLILALIHKF